MSSREKSVAGWIPRAGHATGIAAVLVTLGIALAGCAAYQNHQAIQTERVLSAAGFQTKLADTPEKLASLEALPQRKLVPHTRHDGILFYVYADASACKCLYVGSQKAYQRYQEITIRQKDAEDKKMAAEMNQNAAMDWGLWEPWGPWR